MAMAALRAADIELQPETLPIESLRPLRLLKIRT